MFRSIGHTFQLLGMSWGVLKRDRELLLFPIMAGVAILAIAAVALVIASAGGTLDRIDAVSNSEPGATLTGGDYALGIVLLFLVTFTGIFFNSALIAAAIERLGGADPTVSSGLKAAIRHVDAIIGWAVVATTVGVVLRILQSHDKVGQIVAAVLGGVWGYMTFFVVPVIVVEGIGPFEAVGRSTGLLRSTWSRQVTSAFAFGFAYFLAAIAVVVPAGLAWAATPALGVIVAVVLGALAFGTLAALEGIFRAALYRYTKGEAAIGFDSGVLAASFSPR